MAITVNIKKNGIKRDAVSAEIVYLVEGTGGDAGNVDDEDAYDAVAATSGIEEWDGIPIQNIDVREELLVGTIWEVAVTYGLDGPPAPFDTGSIQYEFNFNAPVGRVYYSLQTIGVFHIGGVIDPSPYKGAIGGQGDDEPGRDLPNPSPTNSWIYNIPNGNVTLAYQQAVEQMMGFTNSVTFKGRAAGTMRLVGVNGGARRSRTGSTEDWQLRFDFQFSANRTNVVLGGITIPFIGGHHLLWSHDQEETDSEDETVRVPTRLIVDRVFHEANMNALGF